MEKRALVSAVFVLAISAAAFWAVYPATKSAVYGWSDPVVTRGEVRAAEWVYDNLPHRRVFACDLFACEMLTAVGFEIGAVGGAWELADNPNQRYTDNERSFLTTDAAEAHSLMANRNVEYVLVAPGRQNFYAYGWKQPEISKFGDSRYFELVYFVDGAYVYRVKPLGGAGQ